MKFKVGDRVKWVGPTQGDDPEYFGTVVQINTNNEYSINVRWDNAIFNSYSHEASLELVKPFETWAVVDEDSILDTGRSKESFKKYYVRYPEYRIIKLREVTDEV
jgi:hypothetical protein